MLPNTTVLYCCRSTSGRSSIWTGSKTTPLLNAASVPWSIVSVLNGSVPRRLAVCRSCRCRTRTAHQHRWCTATACAASTSFFIAPMSCMITEWSHVPRLPRWLYRMLSRSTPADTEIIEPEPHALGGAEEHIAPHGGDAVAQDEVVIAGLRDGDGRFGIHLIQPELAVQPDGHDQAARAVGFAGLQGFRFIGLRAGEIVDEWETEDALEFEMSAGGLTVERGEVVAVECSGDQRARPRFLCRACKVEDVVGDQFVDAPVVVDRPSFGGRVAEDPAGRGSRIESRHACRRRGSRHGSFHARRSACVGSDTSSSARRRTHGSSVR